MRWTRQRFAREGVAGRVERLVSDQQRADERCCSVRRSRVVLTPDAGVKFAEFKSARPGLDKNISVGRRWQKSPVTGESAKETVKTIACGNVGRFRCTRCYSCAFYHYQVHTRQRVQRAPGVPHALFGRQIYHWLGRIARR